MKTKTFARGGVHAPHHKHFTEHKSIEDAVTPAEVTIPLRMHAGAPAKPVVEVGQEVKIGDKIAEADGFISAPIHATISGKIKAIKPHNTVVGVPVESIVIEADEEQPDFSGDNIDVSTLSNEQIVEAVKNAGIVGLGGAAFPTHVKLTPPKEVTIDSLIINGCECEPYLTCDHRLMLERADEMIAGIKLLLKVSGAKKAYIGIENNKADAIDVISKKISNEPAIEVVSLETKYPQGSEKHLIKAIVNREVKAGALPSSVGALVQNVGTAISVYEACNQNKPLIERVVTITGNGVKEPKNLKVRIGTQIKELIEQCGGLNDDVAKIIVGGPMTGFSIFDTSIPVTKGTSGVVVLTSDEVNEQVIDPCVRCGTCVSNCPMGLQPLNITAYIGLDLIEEALDLGLMNCIECGICSFVCPSNRALVQQLKFGKSLAALKRK